MLKNASRGPPALEHRRVARAGVDPGPGRGPQRLGAPAVVAVHVGQEDRANLPPVESQLGHLDLERPGIRRQPRIDQDQPVGGLDHVRGRGEQAAQHVDARYDRDRGGEERACLSGGDGRGCSAEVPAIHAEDHDGHEASTARIHARSGRHRRPPARHTAPSRPAVPRQPDDPIALFNWDDTTAAPAAPARHHRPM